MTDYYISDLSPSEASPYDTMLKAAHAKASVDALMSGGDTAFVASDHTEAISANYTFAAGSQGSPTKYISVNRSTEVEETMQAGGGYFGDLSGAYDLNLVAWLQLIGLKLLVGDNIGDTSGGAADIQNCRIEINDALSATSASHQADIRFKEVDYIQKTPGNIILYRQSMSWVGGTFSLDVGAVATSLFSISTDVEGTDLYVESVDFQDLDSGDYLVEAPVGRGQYKFIGCKVPAAMAGLLTGTIIHSNAWAKFHNVSSDNILVALAEYYYRGIITDETSIYTGASELSIEMAANANVEPGIDGLEYTIFRRKCTANPTFNIEIVADEATALTDNDIYLKIFGPDGTTGALSKLTSTKASDIQNPTTLTSSSASWTGTGGFTNEQKRKITQALTGYQAGVYKIVVVVAKNITAYIDIDVTVS